MLPLFETFLKLQKRKRFFFQPQYVNDGIIVDISPISLPRDFSEMEQIFLAMKNVKVPGDLSIGDGRKFAEAEIKRVVQQKETVDFILLNLRKKNGM